MTLFDSDLYMLMQLIEVGKVSIKETETERYIRIELSIEVFKKDRLREGDGFAFVCEIEKERYSDSYDLLNNRRSGKLQREIIRQKLNIAKDAYKRIMG